MEYKGEMPRKVGGHWCLKEGEGSVKLYDVLSRSSGRIIITTTSLLFLTMCHCTWNSLAGLPRLRGFLGNVRADNQKLHRWGGLVCGVCTVIHVWSLFLPSVLNGYTNKFVNEEPFSWPAQWSLGTSQVDVAARTANWGLDDVWRLVWMSVIFCALFPLSRSIRMLATNYSLAMWLHVGVGLGFFIDSWRRRTHPHVWLWNTPVVLWYVVDRVAGCTWYRTCARDVVRFGVEERVVLAHDPRRAAFALFTPSNQSVANLAGVRAVHMNVPIELLERLVATSIALGRRVVVAADATQQASFGTCTLNTGLYAVGELLDAPLEMSKADRLATHDSRPTHTLVLTGVDFADDDGDGAPEPAKFRAENVRGAGAELLAMSAAWFRAYVYSAVVDVELLAPALLERFTNPETAVHELPPWDALGRFHWTR